MNTESAISGGQLKLLGFISIALGAIAIASPALAASAVVIIIGFIMLAAGIPEVVQGLRSETWRDKIMPAILE